MLCAAVCVLQYSCALSYIYKGLAFKGSVCVCIALCKCARTCKPTMMSGLLSVCVFSYIYKSLTFGAMCMLQCVCCSVRVAVRVLHCVGVHELVSLQ